MFRWLVYGNDSKHSQADTSFPARREFCFTLDGDIFVRYQSFKDASEMQAALERKVPAKIDIGPVYSVNPAERLKYGATFVPVERELVFDIDLTDYDDVRSCGSGGHICERCWPLMAVAVKVIDTSLRDDFGFKHILWVYSGRRGVHAWVCDASARRMTDEQRSSVANWFGIYKGREGDKVKLAMFSHNLHPAVSRAAEMLRTAWVESFLPQQELLAESQGQESVLAYLPEDSLREAVRQQWAKQTARQAAKQTAKQAAKQAAKPREGAGAGGAVSSVERWEALEEQVQLRVSEEQGRKVNHDYKVLDPLQRACNDIIFAHLYPRLDVEVSRKMNHLLKAPFCVHPKTGKVCIPFDPEHVEDFNPCTVPTVKSLLAQLPRNPASAAAVAAGEGGRVKGEEWRDTALEPCITFFSSTFCEPLQRANREEQAEQARAKVAGAQSVAW
ncbi:MAG: hypothetical protein WDW36_006227 [Sanguina aurantia]